jgi:SAM-dependent methyltransferase
LETEIRGRACVFSPRVSWLSPEAQKEKILAAVTSIYSSTILSTAEMRQEEAGLVVLLACPACSSLVIRPYKRGTFSVARLHREQVKITDSQYGEFWDLSVCRDCGHIFANPCPRPDYLLSLYRLIEDPLYEEEAAGRSKNFLRILTFLERILPKKGRIFDVGAATGILLDLARRRGWQPDGIEPSSWAVKRAAEKYHLHLGQGYFETAPLQENHYSAVTMIDFIEHTPWPYEAVKKAGRILEPSGLLVLVTPDIHSAAAKIAGPKWWHLRPAHLSFFSRASLATLLGRAGFTILHERRYAWTFSAHYLVSRKPALRIFSENPFLASFLRRIPLKLALGDSFEIYARKVRTV